MTPEERAVIDAARAYVAYYWGDDAPGSAEAAALYRAVRALPRPLSERLAELRPGDVVEVGRQHLYRGKPLTVLGNRPEGRALWLNADGPGGALFEYEEITRIISNPEPGRE